MSVLEYQEFSSRRIKPKITVIDIEIAEEHVTLQMMDRVTYRDSFQLGNQIDSPVIIGKVHTGIIAIHPESLSSHIGTLEKLCDGGGCFFCKTHERDVEKLKEYIIYDVKPKYVESGFSFEDTRRAMACVCGECYDELRNEISSHPEIASGLL